MFDDLISEIQNLKMVQPGGIRIEIDMPLDDKGYFDRACPIRSCKCNFKVLFVDWREKVPNECAYCPKCGGSATPEEFNTQWQETYIQEIANEYARNAVNDVRRAEVGQRRFLMVCFQFRCHLNTLPAL